MACDFHIIGVLIFVLLLCPWGTGWGLFENAVRLIWWSSDMVGHSGIKYVAINPHRCVEWIFPWRLSMLGKFFKLDVFYVVIVCICHACMFSCHHLNVLSSNLGYAPETFNVLAWDCCEGEGENVASWGSTVFFMIIVKLFYSIST